MHDPLPISPRGSIWNAWRSTLSSAKHFLKRLLGLREFDPKKPFHRIPGMTGWAERENLFRICKEELKGVGGAVELGAFLGASTASIRAGLRSNPRVASRVSGGSTSVFFHVYDLFKARSGSLFAKLTRSFAEQGGVASLLKEDAGWLDFHEVFRSYLGPDDVLLTVHRGPISDLRWQGQPIELIHLDLPKDWKQAHFIVQEMFPSLVPGAYVLFQDFVYHWSAELIAMVGFLLERDYITPRSIHASTLTCQLDRSMSAGDVQDLSVAMEEPEGVLSSLFGAITACAPLLDGESREILELSQACYLYERGRSEEAHQRIAAVLKQMREDTNRGENRTRVFLALSEMFEHGMKLPRAWE